MAKYLAMVAGILIVAQNVVEDINLGQCSRNLGLVLPATGSTGERE